MRDQEWKDQFADIYQRVMAAYGQGRMSPDTMFETSDREFLASIGATAQEIFDYVEDSFYGEDPSYDDVLEVTAMRRGYFLGVMDGKFPERLKQEGEFPRKMDAVDGIRWLPRIIAKARAKLRGELPPDLMYGCGGDRLFLRRVGVRLPEFLKVVRDTGPDDASIVAFYKSKAG
ncbi:MAG: hypothetical protein M2R45_01246 [Verrucomicrobia subdivision 3 bacterium]|nr:hypothetical protein [Limisphaerales bacterium]MCS1415117.1 hypothetical protein [Limisphaerales bacterium]